MKEKNLTLQQKEESLDQHSFVCSDELFEKDLRAIVDDTARAEDETSM
ncbi:hypothetical protein [Peribacillus asahii]|nr:hypothetical protein [Peribacillus asahii]USK85882.1 hypothetical protein LIT35_04325 [Peribacillus asahii]